MDEQENHQHGVSLPAEISAINPSLLSQRMVDKAGTETIYTT
jgi:hypothetical protein